MSSPDGLIPVKEADPKQLFHTDQQALQPVVHPRDQPRALLTLEHSAAFPQNKRTGFSRLLVRSVLHLGRVRVPSGPFLPCPSLGRRAQNQSSGVMAPPAAPCFPLTKHKTHQLVHFLGSSLP